MAHGKNAEKKGHGGKEYWKSRLGPLGESPGRVTKVLTHRKERQKSRRLEREALNIDKQYMTERI